MKKQRQHFGQLPPAQQAGMLCNDPEFQSYVAQRIAYPGKQVSPTGAAEHIRQLCQIQSRRDLNLNTEAAKRFQQMRTDFDAWRGRIATPNR